MSEEEKSLFEKAFLFIYKSALDEAGFTADLRAVWVDEPKEEKASA